MLLLYAFVIGVAAVYCLLAICVAIGPGHWFGRMCVLMGALALLVPIRAYEPLILFGMTSGMLIAGWSAVKLWETRQQRKDGDQSRLLRFQLRDILLCCAVAAAASWMISVLVAKKVTLDWQSAIGSAALLAMVSSLAVCVARYRGWWRLPLLVAGVVAAAAVNAAALKCWWDRTEMLDTFTLPPTGIPRGTLPIAIVTYSILLGVYSLWVLTLAVLASSVIRPGVHPARRIALRGTCAAAFVGALVCLGWVYWRMLDVPEWSPSGADRPNVWPRIMELARSAKNPNPAQADEIYAELFTLLDKPSFVVWPNKRPTTQELNASIELSLTRNLTRGLQARANALSAQSRFDEAADEYLATLRLAPMLDAEGIGVHRWEAEAVRHMAHARLAAFREKLSPAKARESARVMLKVAAGREPIEATDLRDRIWNDRFTWRDMLKRFILTELQNEDVPQLMVREAEEFSIEESCFARLLALDLLIRAYRQDHGEFPGSLEVVALSNCPDLLTDSYSGKSFIYRPSEQGFLLYSVGKNGVDDGGTFTSYPKYMGSSGNPLDLDVDTLIRP